MTNVYAWPPVGALGHEWTRIDPMQRSRSMITGADLRSGFGRSRRMATLTVSGIDGTEAGAGYMESLKRLLAGRHAVRLYSRRLAYRRPNDTLRQSGIVSWASGEDPVTWDDGGTPVLWYTGTYITGSTGTDALGFATITIAGAPANTIIARPAEFVTIYSDPEQTAQVVTQAVTDAAGAATIRVFGTLAAASDVRINIGTAETAVFLPEGEYPRAVRPVVGDWSYTWSFREVFADEVDGGFTEVDPW